MSNVSTTGQTEDERGANEGDGHAFAAVVAGETLQTTVAQLQALVDECHVQLRAEGIRLPATDPAAVASVDVHLDAAAFESYSATEGTLGVDLTRFAEIVGMADREQLVHLELDEETRKLHVAIDELEYTLALIDPDSIRSPPDLSDPGFEFEGHATLETGDLTRVVKAAAMVSDHVALGIDPTHEAGDAFYAEATGDTDDVDVTLPADDLVDIDPGDAHSLYSIDYLADIDRAVPTDADVTLSLGTEVPLGVDYEFADGRGSVEYLLGPRIARN